MSGYRTFLWITFTFLTSEFLNSVETFQCFECENCPIIGEDERALIKECESMESVIDLELETGSTIGASTNKIEGTDIEIESSTTTSPTMSELNSTINSTFSNTFSNSSTLDSLNSTESIQTTNISSEEVQTTKATVESSSENNKVTSSWSMFPKSIEENDLINSDDFGKGRQSKQICYVLKLKHDGKEIVNRGCGLSIQNKEQTCEILTKGDTISECNVCEGRLCNSATGLLTSSVAILFLLISVAANVF